MGALDTFPRRKLSVADFHRMGEAGILGEDDRIELIDGEMMQMAPIGVVHASKVNRLNRMLLRAVGNAANVSVQNPIALPPRDEPQPDIALLKPRADDYMGGLPSATDVLLVVEVADTTLRYDRDIKVPLYSRHGIAEVWLVDLQSESVIVHRQPGPEGYRDVSTDTSGAVISPLSAPSVRLDLAELWRI
ncbi:MAG: Uma2 family endonuclease [Betaproteobacteria bacterium]|nr:Uma2 family endonuclease [Betaproteobacteria bacterium]